MITYPNIDPIAVSIPIPWTQLHLPVRWYGLMYLFGLACAYLLGSYRAKKPNSGWTMDQVSDLVFYSAMGLVIGGRVGYMLFYSAPVFFAEPLTLFKVWQGGMSFHGGILGAACSSWLFARKYQKTFFQVIDFALPLTPIGLGAGRIGNFIGGELYGRITTVPWAMVFPRGGFLPRHPSQLYQCFLEGFVLFTVLWWYSSRPRPLGAISGLFFALYGIFRFLVEFVRQPDSQLNFILFNWVTMGQLLSFPMIILGVGMMCYAYRNKKQI